jgi:hypothetical protein
VIPSYLLMERAGLSSWCGALVERHIRSSIILCCEGLNSVDRSKELGAFIRRTFKLDADFASYSFDQCGMLDAHD